MTTSWVNQPEPGSMRVQFRADTTKSTVDENTNTADATMYDIPHPTVWIIEGSDPSIFVGV
jgi:hypothetical protein